MRFTSIAFATVAVFVSSVAAQNTTCITTCFTDAASKAGCTSVTDTTCVCYNDPFTSAVTACITAACPDSLPALAQAQSALCQGVSPPLVTHASSGTVSVTQTVLPTTTPATLTTPGGTSTPAPTTGIPSTTKPTSTTTTKGTIPSGAASANHRPSVLVLALLALAGGAAL